MAPKKGKPGEIGVCADRIENSVIGEGVEALLPFYNVGKEYHYKESSRSWIPALHDSPYDLPSADSLLHGLAAQQAGMAAVSPFRNHAVCPYVGLRNVGSTCYVNSLLQYLFVNTAFRECILAAAAAEDDEVLRALQLLFGNMQEGCESVCDPSRFVDCSGLARGEQEDVTELWQLLMGYLAPRTKGRVPALISFKQNSVVYCKRCRGASRREELLCELRVRLSPREGGAQNNASSDLEAALRAGFLAEQLSGDNQYACEACGSPQDAQCTHDLQSLPPFLHIVLDRFWWDAHCGERKKICRDVLYPEFLNLSQCLGSDSTTKLSEVAMFELVGVLEHHSQRADSGHYTATLRQPYSAPSEMVSEVAAVGDHETTEGCWWQFNDSAVSRVPSPGKEVILVPNDENSISSSKRWSSASAYMLAYRCFETNCTSGSKYTACTPLVLPQWVEEIVARHSEEVRRTAKDLQELQDRRAALVQQRVEEVCDVPRQLKEASGTVVADLSIVPRKWLTEWLQGIESDAPGEGVARVDYSALLLDGNSAGSAAMKPPARLDPFAMWDGRAKVLPTSILRDFIFKYGKREIQMLPSGLELKDVALEKMMSEDSARTLQELMRCYRELCLQTLATRDANPPDDQPHSGANGEQRIVLIRQCTLTQLLYRLFGTLDYPKQGGRKRQFAPSTSQLWRQITLERKRCRKPQLSKSFADLCTSGTAGERALEMSASSAACRAPEVFDLAAGLRCQHGQLVKRLKVCKVWQKDVDRLCDLAGKQSRLWGELGVQVSVAVRGENLLPASVSKCEKCDNNLKEERACQKITQQTQWAEQRKFPTLFSGELPLCLDAGSRKRGLQPAKFLRDGRYALIAAEWRQRWLAHVQGRDCPAPPRLDAAALRCEHGRLKYDAAEFFRARPRGLEGTRHAHHSIYLLVPMLEAEEALRNYAPPTPSATVDLCAADGAGANIGWCCLQCRTVEPEGCDPVRLYETDPRPCETCAPELAAGRSLDVRLRDERSGRPSGSAVELQVRANIEATGVEVKKLVVEKSGLEGVVAGQLLISVNGRPFGDADILRCVLGKNYSYFHASLSGEILPAVMAEAPAKRQRRSEAGSSLLHSNLATGAFAASIVEVGP